jgi:hypothetical protein
VAEHFTESAGERLYESDFSVVRADAEIQTGRRTVVAVDVTTEQPLPQQREPLFVVKDGRAVLVRDDQWPDAGRLVCMAPVEAKPA